MNKKHRKNKGFSMIELLAAIVILGILSAVTIVSTRYLREKAKTNHYNAQISNMMSAAQNFVGDNSSYLPKNIGQRTTIKLKDLIDKNYIDKILDYNKEECSQEDSYVEVYKYAKDKYSYFVNLSCNNYSSISKKKYQFGPVIDIDISPDEKFKIKITAKGEEEVGASNVNKIASYKYILYKSKDIDSPNYIEKINSGDIETGIVKSVEKTVKFNLEPGEEEALFKIKVTAVDIYGNATTEETETKIIDNEAPECPYGTIDESSTTIGAIKSNVDSGDLKITMDSYEEWVKDSRTISIACSEADCAKTTFTKKFTEETDIGAITISDLVGNKNTCYVPVNIDRTPPKINSLTNSYGDEWANATDLTKKNYVLTIEAEDNIGIDHYSYNYPNSAPTKIKYADSKDVETFTTTPFTRERHENVQIEVCDYAGNCANVLEEIKIDKTSPTLNISNPYLNIWPAKSEVDNNKYILSLSSYESNTGSGIAGYSYQYEGDSKHNYADSAGESTFITTPFTIERKENVIIEVCDNARNCNSGTSLIQIDKTAPNAPEVTATYNYDASKAEGKKATVYESGNSLSLFSDKVFLADKRYSTIKYPSATDRKLEIASRVQTIQISKDATNWYTYSYNESSDLYYATGTGNHHRYLRAIDYAGNISANTDFEIVIDNAPSLLKCPTYAVTRKDNGNTVTKESWINSEVWVNYNFSNSSAKSYQWYTRTGRSGSWVKWQETSVPSNKKLSPDLKGDGVRQGKLVITDGINTKECLTNYYYIDKEDPKCSISKSGTEGENDWYTTSVTLSLNTDDDVSEVASYGLATARKTYNSKTSATQGNTAGITYYGVVKDAAGNEAECNSGSFKVDKTKPTCSLNASGTKNSSTGWYTSNVTVSLTKSGASLKGYGMSTSNSVDYNRTTSLTRDTNTNGTTYYGFVKDEAGNPNKCQLTIKVDKDNPPCSLEVKSGTMRNKTSGYYTSDVKIGFSSTSGLSNYGITTSKTVGYNGKSEYTRTTDAKSITYYGYTKAVSGRTNKCNITIKRDATAPTASISPAAGKYTKMRPVNLTCSDATSGIANSKITFNGKTYGNANKSSTSFNFTTAVTSKTATFTCVDKAGNPTTATRIYTVSNTCPDGDKVFGTVRNISSGNTVLNATNTSSFPKGWCHSNGKTCSPDVGYMRVCIASWCKGLTAQQINDTYKCGYVRYWCTC